MQQIQHRQGGVRISVANKYIGGSLWLPTNIAGCVLWFRSDLGITKDGSNRVSAWTDQSGAGHNATQADNDFKAIYTVSQLNGYPAITFDTTKYMSMVGIEFDSDWTMFGVAKHDSGDTDMTGAVIGESGGAMVGLYMEVGTTDYYIYAGIEQGLVALDVANYTLWESKRTGTVYAFYQNENLTGPVDFHVAPTHTFDTVGMEKAGGDYGLNGGIVEFICYSSALSDSNRQLIEDYLNTRYAIY